MTTAWRYLFLIICLQACRSTIKPPAEEALPLYPDPVTLPLETAKGYIINPITGDSIKPLLNAAGYPVPTGAPLQFTGETISSEKILKPTIIDPVAVVKTIIPDNVYPIPAKRSVISIDTARLKKVKLGEGDRSLVLRNTYGAVPTGIAIPVTGKKMPFSEPHSVKAAPMRFKDNASTRIQYLDVEQGLNYSYVLDLCEDKKGSLWFAMDAAGLVKYDGINITNYTVKEGLSHDDVHCLFPDRNNNIWLGTQRGVTCFDGKNFIQYTEKEGLSNNMVTSISEDKKGNLWFCTFGGVTKYNGKDFTHYSRKEGLPSDTVYDCMEDRNGSMWFATYHGAAKFDGNFFTHYTREDGLAAETVTRILEDKDGNIWFATIKGINKFDGKDLTYFSKDDGLSSDLSLSMISDRNGNIWIGTLGGGLNKFDGKNFTHYDIEQGLSNNKLRAIIQDKNGNIWCGTDGGGVNKISVTSFDYKIPEEVMDNNRIRPILKDKKGNIWLGTDDGHVGKLEAEQKQRGERLFTYYKIQDKFIAKGQRSLLQDKKGNIWIGTTGAGIIKYDGTNFTNYSLGTSVEKQAIFDMLEDKKGNIWFGTRDGDIARYDGKDFAFYKIQQGLPGSIIYSMLEDKKGNIWFCTEGAGVYKYDGEALTNYTEKEGLFCKKVTSIAEDDNGNIWFGSLGSGVCRFDGSSFTYYTEQQGLSNNNVWSVFCDPSNNLWFGTNKGLTLFVPKSNDQQKLKTGYSVYNFDSRDGLKAIDFNLHSVCLDKDNHIWWGTGKGVTSFDLNTGFHSDSLRSLHLNNIEINEQFYDFRNLSDSLHKKISFRSVIPFSNCPENLSLSYDLNHLSFNFSAIDWSAPDKIKYSYRMIGLNESWSRPIEEPVADYRNLGFGSYQFQVRAIGQSQIWTAPFVYDFTIRPAWWQTWWFKVLLILAALTAAFLVGRFIYFYQLRKQKVALEKKLAVQYERQRISAEMHDDIGAGLSGIRLLTEITKNKINDEQAAAEIEKIYQSVGDISSKMKEVIWSLNAENDNLLNLLSYLQKQVRSWLEHYPCRLSIELPDNIPAVEIKGEARRNIMLIFKEAIHNIIKHSRATEVRIRVNCSDQQLGIIISDNGKGMTGDQTNNVGNGMKNMRNRVENLNGKLSIKNGEGLTLTFEIPLQPMI